MTCFYSLSEQNAQLKEEKARFKEENARFKEALEWISEYSALTDIESATLPAAFMVGLAECKNRAWEALREED